MKRQQTPNAQRRTPNIEWRRNGDRIRELPGREYGSRREYDLEDRLLDFAVAIVRLVEALPNTRSGNHIAGQLLRCGTSPLSNHGEVEAAESRKDFLHKLPRLFEGVARNQAMVASGWSTRSRSAIGSHCVPERSGGIDPNLRGQRSDYGEEREMIRRFADFNIGRSALNVRRFLPRA